MGNEKNSRPSMKQIPVAAINLGLELRRLKIEPERIFGETVDTAQAEGFTRLLRLISYIETHAEPIIAINVGTGAVEYANQQAIARFPQLRTAGTEHPCLKGWAAIADDFKGGRRGAVTGEMNFGMAAFERKATYDPTNRLMYLEFSEARKPKEQAVASLANPFAVFEFSPSINAVTSRNEAARRLFPSIKPDHPMLKGIPVERLRSGEERYAIDTVEAEGKVFRRGASYSAHGDIVRVFAADVGDASSRWKVRLLDMIRKLKEVKDPSTLAKDTADLLALLKKEKVEIGRIELEIHRLGVIVRQLDGRETPGHEIDSARSVVIEYLESLLKPER
ncbi:MAG: hypothetical protein U0R44_01770 [Candidatus Micrarchaeia archaeon]